MIIVIIVSLAAGSALVWQGLRVGAMQAENRDLHEKAAQVPELCRQLEELRKVQIDTEELNRLRTSEATLQHEVSKLRGQLGGVLRSRTNGGSTLRRLGPGVDGVNSSAGASEANGAWASSASTQYVEAQINRARERLNLTQDQEQNLRGVVNKALDEGKENLQKVLAGKARMEDVPSQYQWAKALEQQVLETLTPEQQIAYQKYKREDTSANARLLANGELLLVQNNLGLNEQQQDQMFAVLFNSALGQLDPDPNTPPAQSRNPVAVAEWHSAQKLKALESVLQPGQIDTYRKMQESYLQSMKGILARFQQ